MSDDDQNGDDEYRVGPGKPPKHTQFKKGEASPNPRGRPTTPKDDPGILRKALQTKVPVVSEGKKRRMSKFEIVVNAALHSAMKGEPRGLDMLLKLMDRLNIKFAEPPPVKGMHWTVTFVNPDGSRELQGDEESKKRHLALRKKNNQDI